MTAFDFLGFDPREAVSPIMPTVRRYALASRAEALG